jgi:hypothetical protein
MIKRFNIFGNHELSDLYDRIEFLFLSNLDDESIKYKVIFDDIYIDISNKVGFYVVGFKILFQRYNRDKASKYLQQLRKTNIVSNIYEHHERGISTPYDFVNIGSELELSSEEVSDILDINLEEYRRMFKEDIAKYINQIDINSKNNFGNRDTYFHNKQIILYSKDDVEFNTKFEPCVALSVKESTIYINDNVLSKYIKISYLRGLGYYKFRVVIKMIFEEYFRNEMGIDIKFTYFG